MKRWTIFLVMVATILWGSCRGKGNTAREDYAAKRKAMVRNQISNRGIRDERVLKVMETVPRHEFIPEKYRSFAYEDTPLPIGQGQTISQPYIVALMTECLELSGRERVLEVGTGSGYQSAILAHLTKEVYTIEILEDMARRAEQLLQKMGYRNIKVKCGDGYLGWKEYAPFDAIIVTCAPDHIPEPLLEQLAEGGRMIIPIEEKGLGQVLKKVEKEGGILNVQDIVPVRFVPMIGNEVEKRKKHGG